MNKDPHEVILSFQENQIRGIHKMNNSIGLCKKNCMITEENLHENIMFEENILHKQAQHMYCMSST
jgi:hypothetical protein